MVVYFIIKSVHSTHVVRDKKRTKKNKKQRFCMGTVKFR